MIHRMRLTPTRIVAQLALAVPVLAVGMMVLWNVASTNQWSPLALSASALALALVTLGALALANQVANSVADRIGSERLPWATYGAALIAAWAPVAALLFVGAQFQAVDDRGTGGFTLWAAGSAMLGAAALIAATVIGITAIVRATRAGHRPSPVQQ